MKQIRASVHREARFHIRGCANQSNNDNNDHLIMQMEKSTLIQLQRHRTRCHLKYCNQIPTTIQQLFWPAQAVSTTTMLYVLYLSTLYLVVATNVCISGAAAAAATGSGAVAAAATTSNSTVATFIASNKLSGENDIQRNGPVYAALSGAHSNVPTTIDPGEYILYHNGMYIKMLTYATLQQQGINTKTYICALCNVYTAGRERENMSINIHFQRRNNNNYDNNKEVRI